MDKTDSFSERLTRFLKHKKVRNNEFGRSIGVTKATASHIMNGKANITLKTLFGILNHYPELNVTWLFTGEGKMLNSQQSDSEQEQKNTVNEEQGAYLNANAAKTTALYEQVIEAKDQLITSQSSEIKLLNRIIENLEKQIELERSKYTD